MNHVIALILIVFAILLCSIYGLIEVAILEPQNGDILEPRSDVPMSLTANPAGGTFRVQLYCNSSLIHYGNIVANSGSPQTFAIHAEYQGNACVFSVVDSPDGPTGFIGLNNVTVAIDPLMDLTFTEPTENDSVIKPTPISILVQSLDNVYIVSELTLLLNCTESANEIEIPVYSNSPAEFNYGNIYFGACTLNVTSYPSYFIPPEPVTFFLKTELVYINFPAFAVNGRSYLVQIDTVGAISGSYSTVSLALHCDTIQTWPEFPLNEEILITVEIPMLNVQTLCAFKTDGTSQIYAPSISLVTVLPFAPPNGGEQFYPISSEQIIAFSQSLAYMFQGPITNLTVPV